MSQRTYPFHQVDVFADAPLSGNPLAVLFADSPLTDSEMQGIAREMNLSETTFILPYQSLEDISLRIFSPARELPFAGHPVLGSAFVLAGRERSLPRALGLRLGEGLFSVAVESHKGRIQKLWMQQPGPTVEPVDLNQALLARGLALKALDPRYPVKVASTGLPALIVPVPSLPAIREIELNLSVLREILDRAGAPLLYCFTCETETPGASVHARVFAPFAGIPEDPATGSAAGALAGYLYKNAPAELFGTDQGFVIEQGIEMDRPSRIFVKVEGGENGEIQSVRVGGSVIPVLEGELKLPCPSASKDGMR